MILLLFLTMAIVSRPCPCFKAVTALGDENQLSNSTYFADNSVSIMDGSFTKQILKCLIQSLEEWGFHKLRHITLKI